MATKILFKKISGAMLFLHCFLIQQATAQNLKPIATDRPDQTESPFIVPKKYFQAEIGFVSERTDKDVNTYIYPNALLKYGLTGKTELRLVLEMESSGMKGNRSSGLNPVIVGFKTNICEEKGIIPTTSFIGHLAIPKLAGSNKQARYFAPSFRFNMQHTLSETFSFSYNLGSAWDGWSPEPEFLYTVALGFSLSDAWGGYAECYGFAPQYQKAQHLWDAGITYLINPNLQLDMSGGTRISKEAAEYFIGCGISFRLPVSK